MVCFGAVILDDKLDKTFYGKTKPISDNFISSALAISGFTREEHILFDNPKDVMVEFKDWILSNSKGIPTFISDNNGYDWSFINYYFHYYIGNNPFGFSSRRIGDIYCGAVKDMSANKEWKRLRKTKHTHNPVDDAIGNAQALLEFRKMNIKNL